MSSDGGRRQMVRGFVSAVLIGSLLAGGAAQAADTPEGLAEAMMQAIVSGNRNAYRALLHPEGVSGIEAQYPGQLEEHVYQMFAEVMIPPARRIEIEDVRENIQQTKRMGSYSWSVTPTHFMRVMSLEGTGTSKLWMWHAIAQRDDGWFIIPMAIDAE